MTRHVPPTSASPWREPAALPKFGPGPVPPRALQASGIIWGLHRTPLCSHGLGCLFISRIRKL